METGSLPQSEVLVELDGVKFFGESFDGLSECKTVGEMITGFTGLAEDGDYIAINAYLPRMTTMK